MPSDPDTSRTRPTVRRDILLLLAVAGFTACMTFFYWLKAPRHVEEPALLKSGTVALFGTPHESEHLIDDFLTRNEHYGKPQGS